MVLKIRTIFFSLAFGVLFSGAAQTFAQTAPEVPLTGGYQTAAVTDSQIVVAANYAVISQAKKQRSKIKLIAVSRAEKQVVAGLNYRLCLQVEVLQKNKKTSVPQTVQTIVFQNLKQKFAVTSWAIAACTEEIPIAVTND